MRCPVCRAENGEDAACRRCKADLSMLVALEQSRRAELAEALRAAAMGDGARSLAHAETAHQLRPAPDTWRGLALAYMLTGEYERALACRAQAKQV